jgi:hypothetical protein
MTPRTLLLVTLGMAAPAAALVAGCGVGPVGTDATSGHPTVDAAYEPGMADGGGGSDAAADAGVASTHIGSPLCHLSPLGCNPDLPTTAKDCLLAPDGGPYNSAGGYDNAPLACHVPPSSGTNADAGAPVCAPAGTGADGVRCSTSTDCAPRYECVGDGAEGTCRRYCCTGNVTCDTSEFCDIQPMTGASATDVPVCIPISPDGGCHLLDDSSCPSTETCAVVREDGATSCVAIGAPGDRRCYQLCHTADPAAACSATQTCKGGLPLFPDSSVGICQ